MGAVVGFIPPQFAAQAKRVGGRHERAGLARFAIPVIGRTHQEVDIGRVKYASRRQVPRVLLIDSMRCQVSVIGTNQCFAGRRLPNDMCKIQQGVSIHIADEIVEIDRLPFAGRVPQHLQSLRSASRRIGHRSRVEVHLRVVPGNP